MLPPLRFISLNPGKTEVLMVLPLRRGCSLLGHVQFWEFRPFLQRSLPSRCNRILMQRHQITKCRHIMIYLKLFHVSCRKKAPIKKSHKQMQESHKQSFAKCNFLRFFQLLKKQYYVCKAQWIKINSNGTFPIPPISRTVNYFGNLLITLVK